MYFFLAQLANEHIQDLLREAEAERLAKLARAGNPHAGTLSTGVVPRVRPILRRLRKVLVGPLRPRPQLTSTDRLLKPALKEHPADPFKWHVFGRLER